MKIRLAGHRDVIEKKASKENFFNALKHEPSNNAQENGTL